MAKLLPIYFSVIAFFCALGAMALAIFHIYRHLLNYTEPTYQRYIVRIIFMVPVDALLYFLSLIFPESSIYFNSICEVYEAWVIYNFLSLCLAWVGGPGAVVLSLSGRVMNPSWCLMTCCFPSMPLDGRFIRREFWFFWLQSLDSLRMQKKLLSFKILLYMLIVVVGHLYAFPYKEYAGANIAVSYDLTRSLAHALKLNDLYHDTVHQFAPTYHDYVLYNHIEGDDGTRKYRSRTFVPTGQEMDDMRKNKLMFGNKMDELSSHSSSAISTPKNDSSVPYPAHSDAMKSSHLIGVSDSLSSPYDMSLIDMDFSNYPAKVAAANETRIR